MKQHGSKSGLIAAISLLLLAWSCSDDQLSPNQNAKGDDEMHFFSYIASNADAKSRVDAGESKYESFNYQKCENSDIYLITAVEDGIDGTQLASYEAKDMVTECENMSAPESRAAQLTQETLLSKYLNNTADDGKWAIDLYAFKYPAKTTYNQVDAANDNLTLSDVFAQARVDGDVSDVVQTIKQEQLTTSETTSTTTQNVALTSDVKHYWDAYEGNRITFVGLFPSYKSKYGSQDESTLTVAEYRMKNDTVFEYCMSPKAANQIDFLYGQKSYPANSGQSIVLPLRHILTGIKVKLSTGFEGCKITKVEFDNVNGLGWFNIASGEWMKMTGINKVTFSSEKGNQGTMIYGDGTTEFEETGADATSEDFFMAIPQGLGSLAGGIAGDTKIKITVKHADGSTMVHTADLNGTTWEAGKTVTYALSIDTTLSDYYIATEFSSMKCGWAGYPAGFMEQYSQTYEKKIYTYFYGTGIRVKSYKITTTKNANGTITKSDPVNVPWEVFYEDGSSTGIEAGTTSVYDLTDASAVSSFKLDAYIYDLNKDTYDKNSSQYDFMKQDYNYLFFLMMSKGAQTRETVASTEEAALAKFKNIPQGENSSYYWRRKDLSDFSQAYVKNGNNYSLVPYYTDSSHKTYSSESANCYMIQFPGYYEIPCVYGNSMHQNRVLRSSFETDATGTGAMGTLKRHDGNNITANNNDTGSWIARNGSTPTNAVLLWEDSPGLITKVQLINPYNQFASGAGYRDFLSKYSTNSASNPYVSTDYWYVAFDVAQGDNFKPGNAVIAVTNGTTVLWSWHIWVTPWAGGDRFTADASDNATGDYAGKQQYLKVPLGYVERSSYKWAARAEKLTLKQYEKNSSGTKVYKQSCVMAFQQDEHILNRSSCCYYQWGRKDPFPGAIPYEYEDEDPYIYNNSDGSNNGKTGGYMKYDGTYAVGYKSLQTGGYITYGNTNEAIIAASGSDRTVGIGIQHPMWYFLAPSSGATSRFPSDNNYYDLWGQNISVTSEYLYQFPSDAGSNMRKTVYDPCPYGFKVPPIHGLPAVSFQGFPCFTSLPSDIDVDKDHRRELTESALYAQAINSPYTDHSDFVHNLSYEFYTNRMTLAGKPGGDTYKVYALGYIGNDYSYSTSGTLPFYGFGSMATYWSSSRWASSTAASTVNIVNDIVTANIYSCMMMMKMSYGGLNSSIVPVYGSYNDFGCPILPIYDTYLPIY